MDQEIRDVVVVEGGGGLRGKRLVLEHSKKPCKAKKDVKNCYFTTGQLLTIKPEKKKRTTYRFKRIANFVCMKIYTKYDNQNCVNSKSNQWVINFQKKLFLINAINILYAFSGHIYNVKFQKFSRCQPWWWLSLNH